MSAVNENPKPLMQRLVEAGYADKLDHHASDLYVEVTSGTDKIIKEWMRDNGYKTDAAGMQHWTNPFKDQITGKLMYDVPFQYIPYWDKISVHENTPPVQKLYDVEITETLQRTVSVKAESREAALAAVEDMYNRGEVALTPEDLLDSEIEVATEREATMNVLLVQPGMYPKPVTIGCELEDLQKAVGGLIEATYPYDDLVAIITNDEGKLNGLPLNRALRTEDGQMYDIIAGDFLVVGLTDDNFGSLSPALMAKYEKFFHDPEMFLNTARGVMVLSMTEEHPQEAPSHEEPDEPSLDDDDEWER